MKRYIFIKKMTHLIIAAVFLCSGIAPAGAQGLSAVAGLPVPGTMVGLTASYQSPILVGLKIHPENPLMFDFIVDMGSSSLAGEELKAETEKLVKYFLAALTIPDKEVWVNLSPYEKERILPNVLGQTVMGKTMLEQDYLLKQLASTLTDPEQKLGQEFWAKVKKQVESQFGHVDVPMNTFNKVWIVPGKAEVLENTDVVVIGERHLKVMMDQDYVALANQQDSAESRAAAQEGMSKITTEIFRDTILPNIETEINQGKNFTAVRQIYNSVILATWYKQALKESFLGKVYADKGKVAGIETEDIEMKQRIYEQYVEAFKKGVYNLIQEEADSATGDLIPRKYFSGGANFLFSASSPLERRQAGFVDMADELERVRQMEGQIWESAEKMIEVIVSFNEFDVITGNGALFQPENLPQLRKLADAGFPIRTAESGTLTQDSTQLAPASPAKENGVKLSEMLEDVAESIAQSEKATKRFQEYRARVLAIIKAYRGVAYNKAKRLEKNALLIQQINRFVNDPLIQSDALIVFHNDFTRRYDAARAKNEDGFLQIERFEIVMSVINRLLTEFKLAAPQVQPVPQTVVADAPIGRQRSVDNILRELLKNGGELGSTDRVPPAVREVIGKVFDYAKKSGSSGGWAVLVTLPRDKKTVVLRFQDSSFSGDIIRFYNAQTAPWLEKFGFSVESINVYDRPGQIVLKDALVVSSMAVRTIINEEIKASAPTVEADSSLEPAAVENVGGIDFDATKIDLQIKRDGNGIPLPIQQQNWDQINIEGLVPVIINIAPIDIKNLPIYLGQNTAEPKVMAPEQDRLLKDAS